VNKFTKKLLFVIKDKNKGKQGYLFGIFVTELLWAFSVEKSCFNEKHQILGGNADSTWKPKFRDSAWFHGINTNFVARLEIPWPVENCGHYYR